MKITTCLFSILLLPSCLLGQNNFIEHKINQPLTEIQDIAAGDIDGDGEKDIAAISAFDNYFVWYKKINNTPYYQSSFTDLPNASQGSSLILADLDGDGDVDAIHRKNQSGIEWLSNNGDGNFATPSSITSTNLGAAQSSFEILDFDNDGDLDIFSNTTLLTNDGNQNFSEANLFEYGGHKTIIDFDQDGLLDFVISGRYIGLLWIKQNTDGSFSENWIAQNSSGFNYIEHNVGDLNADGYLDIAYSYNGGSTSGPGNELNILYNSGDNLSFTSSTNLISGGANEQVKEINLTDIDSDGDLDILTYYSTYTSFDSGVQILLNNEGTFSSTHYEIYFSNEWYGNPSGTGYLVEDMTNDGTPDVITCHSTMGRITFYSNHEVDYDALDYYTFNFSEVTNSSGTMATGNSYLNGSNLSFQVADLNNDNYMDVMCFSKGDFHVEKHLNTGDNTNFNSTLSISIGQLNSPNNVKLADFSGDGNLQMLYAIDNQVTNNKLYLSPSGESYFANFYDTNRIIYESSNAFIFNYADIDNDGALEILIFDYGTKVLSIVNLTEDSFSVLPNYTVPSNFTLSGFDNLVDMNGDGYLDMPITKSVGSTYTSTAYSYLENTNGLGFMFQNNAVSTGNTEIQTGASPVLMVTDLDNDGDLDYVGTAATLINDGTGLYDVRYDILSGYETNFKIADIDNDGDNDIIALNGDVVFYQNNDMLFTPVTISEGFNYHSFNLEIVDFDNDSDLDIVYTSVGSNKIAWIENNTETLSIEDNTEKDTLELLYYPNPVKDALTLKSNILFDNYKVLDYSGKLIKKGEVKNSQLSLSNLTPGLYLIQLYNEGNITTLKIVKE